MVVVDPSDVEIHSTVQGDLKNNQQAMPLKKSINYSIVKLNNQFETDKTIYRNLKHRILKH